MRILTIIALTLGSAYPVMVVQAQRLPTAGKVAPAMTDDDRALQPHMKKLVAAYVAMRRDIEKTDKGSLTAHVTIVKGALKDVETFFAERERPGAAKLAVVAASSAQALAAAADYGDWKAVANARLALNQSCEACHTANRDRFDDGAFRIKRSDRG
jgi:hypothetical protein